MVVLLNIAHNASATAFVVVDFKATALGHFVAKHMLVNINSHPPFPFGNGPTKSMAIASKGSAVTGLVTIGAFLGQYFEFN